MSSIHPSSFLLSRSPPFNSSFDHRLHHSSSGSGNFFWSFPSENFKTVSCVPPTSFVLQGIGTSRWWSVFLLPSSSFLLHSCAAERKHPSESGKCSGSCDRAERQSVAGVPFSLPRQNSQEAGREQTHHLFLSFSGYDHPFCLCRS